MSDGGRSTFSQLVAVAACIDQRIDPSKAQPAVDEFARGYRQLSDDGRASTDRLLAFFDTQTTGSIRQRAGQMSTWISRGRLPRTTAEREGLNGGLALLALAAESFTPAGERIIGATA
jgi:hypothetical protein